MADHETQNGHAEMSRIDALIGRTRRLLRSSWVATGAGMTLGLCLAAVVATTLADLAVPLPVVLRTAGFLLVVVPTLMALYVGVLRPAVRRISENWVARRIEREIPQIQSRLVTSIDLAHHPDYQHSTAFYNRLVSETADRVSGFHPSSVIDRLNLRRSGVFAAAAAVAFLFAYACFSDRLPTALARILSPFADIPPATGVVFDAEPGDAKVLKGDDFTIAAVIKKGEPTDMQLEFRGSDGKWVRHAMTGAEPGRFEFTIEQLADSIDYRLVGGGTWTRKHRVEVIERPAIADLHAVVRFPEYMKLPEPKIGPLQTGDAAGPVGSDVQVVVAASGSVAGGELQVLSPITKMRPIKDRKERVWFEGSLPAGAAPEGTWQWDHGLKFRPAHMDAAASGPHSHGFHGAKPGFEIQPGDHLYTYVLITPGQVPEQIMLQFHDGTNHEQRAYWGADKIQAGAPNTPSRFRVGDLPAPGDWALLDVPAKALGLEGKKIHGMSFMLFGGQAKFNRAGTIEPAEVAERSYIVEWRYPMSRSEESTSESSVASTPQRLSASTSLWSGHIPLTRDSLYRIELKNELGYTNKEMKESKLTAIPDNPPQVILERPGADLVVSEPQKIPLVIRAYDDFGLSDVALAVQKGDSGGFVGSPVKVFEDPVRSESILAALDLKTHALKPGEFVRYRVQARDRKGQIAQTQEFVVKLAADPNAADKQLAAVENQYDSFQKKLVQLIEQQSKITETAEKLAGTERPAEQSNQPKDAAAQKASDIKPAPTSPPKADAAQNPASNQPKPGDPATAAELEKKLAELRQELAKLAGQEEANAQLGQQIQGELTQAANQMAASKLVPDELAAQMRAAEQMFQASALQPIRELVQAMKHQADPKQKPDASAIAESSAQLEHQLESMKSRLDAIAQAQKNLKNDPAEALAQLREDLMNENAELTAQELAQLRDFLDRLMGQMKMLEGRENMLAQQTKEAMPVVLPEIEQEQTKIEADAEKLLAQADRLMEAENLRDMNRRRRTPEFPDAPYTPDSEEMIVPPSEEDTPEPASAEMQGKDSNSKKDDSKMDEEEEDLFMPPTGVRQKIDPRFAKKARPTAKPADAKVKADSQKNHQQNQPEGQQQNQSQPQPNDPRGRLAQRQQQTAQQLNAAQQQLQPRRDQLAQLMQELQQALGLESEDAAQELAQLMQSMDMQQALQLAQAMRRSQAQQQSAQQPGQPQQPQLAQAATPPSLSSTQLAGMRVGLVGEFEANDIDLAAATIILKMQPRLREELLRGMKEEGPEAYRKFIQDYFNRLTKVKSSQ
jgi:hypothetical protein